LRLLHKLFGPYVSLLEVDISVFDTKCTDIPVSVEPLYRKVSHLTFSQPVRHFWRAKYGIIFDKRRKMRIGHHSVEGAINLGWDLSNYLEIINDALESAGFHEP
jgi:hypothetical protein